MQKALVECEPSSCAVRIPKHLAIVMDGNGRWAEHRQLPRPAGHLEGVKTVRRIVGACAERGIKVLTLFAFSSENWQRPQSEVRLLLGLFLTTLRSELRRLQEHQIRLRVIGDLQGFPSRLRQSIRKVEQHTQQNTGMLLVVAANYGGRWDILQAIKGVVKQAAAQQLNLQDITSAHIQALTSLGDLPDPQLLIRTGGEQRLSNFFLWQSAETVCHFTQQLWPDYGLTDLDQALVFFSRQVNHVSGTGGHYA